MMVLFLNTALERLSILLLTYLNISYIRYLKDVEQNSIESKEHFCLLLFLIMTHFRGSYVLKGNQG